MTLCAVRSLESIRDVARAVAGRAEGDRLSACTLRQIFDLVAWSDRTLSGREENLLDAVVGSDLAFGREFAACEPNMDDDSIPPLLTATLDHDRKHDSVLGYVLIDSMETLAYSIVWVDGKVRPDERDHLRALMRRYRDIAEPAYAC